MQDYIAMVLVWLATEQGAAAAEGVEQGHISDKLESLEKLLDSGLVVDR